MRRGVVGDEGQLQVVDDAVHHRVVYEEEDAPHRSAALGAEHGSTSYTLQIISAQPLVGILWSLSSSIRREKTGSLAFLS